jgi:hypothetical protein
MILNEKDFQRKAWLLHFAEDGSRPNLKNKEGSTSGRIIAVRNFGIGRDAGALLDRGCSRLTE